MKDVLTFFWMGCAYAATSVWYGGVIMPNFFKTTTLAAVAALGLAGAASANTVTITGSTPGSPGANDFNQLSTYTFITYLADMVVNGNSRITFTEVGAESGYNNDFTASGTKITETSDFGINLSGDYVFQPGESFFKDYADGTSLMSVLSFGSNSGVDADPGDYGFGVYALGSSGDSFSHFYLAYDDSNGTDDNHDDYIIEVRVAAIPIPAAGWMLFAVLGGAAALGRRKMQA